MGFSPSILPMPCNGGLRPILLMYPFLCVGCIPAPLQADCTCEPGWPECVSVFQVAFGIGGRLKGCLKNKHGGRVRNARTPCGSCCIFRHGGLKPALCVGLPENGAFRPCRQVSDSGRAGRKRGRHRRFCRCSRRLRPRRRRGRCGLRPRVAAWCRGGRGRRVWVRAGA